MAIVRVQTDAKEPIEVLAVGLDRQPITGLTNLKARVRRVSDDWFLDWSDDTFKPSGSVSSLLRVLSEVNASAAPGKYHLNTSPHTRGLDLSVFTNAVDDDSYLVTVVQDGTPQNVANVPQVGEIKEGDYVDFLDRKVGDDHTVLMAFSYDQTNDRLDANVWVERSGMIYNTPGDMGACTLTLYDVDGAVQFAISDTAPDGQGVYKISKAAPGLTADTLYYATAEIPIVSAPDGIVSGVKGMFTL